MNDISLRDHFEKMIADLDRRHDDHFEATDNAISKAERALQSLTEEVQTLRRERANLEGRQFIWSGVISTIIAIAVALLAQWIR